MYKFREKDGVDAKYNADTLAKKFDEFIDHLEEHPEKEATAFHYQGSVKEHGLAKKTPLTIIGFCLYAGIIRQTFLNYANKLDKLEADHKLKPVKNYAKKLSAAKDLLGVITHIRDACYSQKFNGAASGFFNPSIIARDLGLVDKKQVDDKTKKVLEVRIKESGRKKRDE